MNNLVTKYRAMQAQLESAKDGLIVRNDHVNNEISALTDEYTALHAIVGYPTDSAVHAAIARLDARKAARMDARRNGDQSTPGFRRSIESAQSRAYNKSIELLTLAQDTAHDDRIARAIELIRDALQDRIQRAKDMREHAALQDWNDDDDDRNVPVSTNGHARRKI